MTRTLINIILIIALCLVGYGWYQESRENRDLKTIIKEPSTGIPLEAEIIARKVDSAGLEHAIAKDAAPILNTIELKVEDKRKVDSLLKVVDIKDKQLTSYTRTLATVSQENIQLRRVVDVVTQDTVYRYQDKWLDLSFQRTNDTLALGSFKYDIDLEHMQYWKRKWFLGTKHSYTDIWSADKRVTIGGFDRLTIKQDEPQYGLRVQANAVWNPETGSLGYGPGLRIDINRFSIQGKYSYYPSLDEWRPMISGNFDLIRF